MTSNSPSPPEPAAASKSRFRDDAPWWIYPTLLLAAIVITALVARRTDQVELAEDGVHQPAAWAPSPRPEGETVRLEIDFGNGAHRVFEALPWEEGMTVADLMVVARAFQPPIHYEQRGEGEAAFLVSLEGVAGGGPDSRNWLYRVNGEHAKVSFGIYPLEPSDEVLWIYDVGE